MNAGPLPATPRILLLFVIPSFTIGVATVKDVFKSGSSDRFSHVRHLTPDREGAYGVRNELGHRPDLSVRQSLLSFSSRVPSSS